MFFTDTSVAVNILRKPPPGVRTVVYMNFSGGEGLLLKFFNGLSQNINIGTFFTLTLFNAHIQITFGTWHLRFYVDCYL